MRKAGTFLCGILAAALLTGCTSPMPDLTQEETDLISEYAVGVLLKHDKYLSGRLIDTSAYDIVDEEAEEELSEEESMEETPVDDTGAGDVSQEVEVVATPSTIQDYYGIEGFTFQYMGYDLTQSYPSSEDDETLFFSMDATEGEQLVVMRFLATNTSSFDQTLNMIGYGARFRVSVNGESSQSVLTTMLLNDLQTYNDMIPAGSSVELVSVIEIPQSVSVETIDFIMRGNDENATMSLQ